MQEINKERHMFEDLYNEQAKANQRLVHENAQSKEKITTLQDQVEKQLETLSEMHKHIAAHQKRVKELTAEKEDLQQKFKQEKRELTHKLAEMTRHRDQWQNKYNEAIEKLERLQDINHQKDDHIQMLNGQV